MSCNDNYHTDGSLKVKLVDTIIVNDTVIVPAEVKNIKCNTDIVVNSCMVTQTNYYGYLPKGSALFDYSNCEKGFIIQVKTCGKIISTSYCPKRELKKYIDRIKYEMSIKDSIVFTIPINQSK